jgi:hypothetical protein
VSLGVNTANVFLFAAAQHCVQCVVSKRNVTYWQSAQSALMQSETPFVGWEVRMPTRQMFGNLTFEPADIEAMSRALEAACVALQLSKREEPLRQIVARKVIECASTGERDPRVLCRMVVLELQREVLEDCGDSNSAGVV